MKRIGILTFHRAINNGAVLQAYALADAFNKMNCDARYIDYTAKRISDDYYIKPLFKRRSIKSIGVYFLFDLNITATHNKFHEFVSRYIPVENCDINDAVCIKNKFDILVSGGDQIWNLKLTDGDTKYYLDFSKDIAKYSYGTSFGTTSFTDDEIKKIKRYLEDYQQLNVRERSAKVIIDNLVTKECNVVPDPVFLLSKNEWIEQLSLKEVTVNNNYVLYFELHENDEMREYALHLARENNCKVLRITNDLFKIKGMKNIKRTGPIEFLNFILNASFIVTDSFHAAAFALIFNRPLFIGLKHGEFAHLNTRMENLTSTFNIRSQIISGKMIEQEIDYNKVNYKLKEEQKKGLLILQEIIGNDENEY